MAGRVGITTPRTLSDTGSVAIWKDRTGTTCRATAGISALPKCWV